VLRWLMESVARLGRASENEAVCPPGIRAQHESLRTVFFRSCRVKRQTARLRWKALEWMPGTAFAEIARPDDWQRWSRKRFSSKPLKERP